MAIYALLIGICWLAFVVVWATSAFSAKRNVRRGWGWLFKGIFIRIVMVAIVIWAFSDGFAQQYVAYSHTLLPNQTLGTLGVVLAAAGVALAIWARLYLGRNWGMPMSLKVNPELVTTGPYAYIRNPIYTGVLLAMLGSALVAGLWWLAIFVASAIYFIYSALVEEKIMLKEFPNTYPAYKKRTKMLVPFIF